MTVELLRDSFYSLKRKAAPGVDGITWAEYEIGLEGRIIDLHGRVHRGAYRAQPSRRVYIEKEDGRKRPLGVAALPPQRRVYVAGVECWHQEEQQGLQGIMDRLQAASGRCRWADTHKLHPDFGLLA